MAFVAHVSKRDMRGESNDPMANILALIVGPVSFDAARWTMQKSMQRRGIYQSQPGDCSEIN
jgi:hypothetical protein